MRSDRLFTLDRCSLFSCWTWTEVCRATRHRFSRIETTRGTGLQGGPQIGAKAIKPVEAGRLVEEVTPDPLNPAGLFQARQQQMNVGCDRSQRLGDLA